MFSSIYVSSHVVSPKAEGVGARDGGEGGEGGYRFDRRRKHARLWGGFKSEKHMTSGAAGGGADERRHKMREAAGKAAAEHKDEATKKVVAQKNAAARKEVAKQEEAASSFMDRMLDKKRWSIQSMSRNMPDSVLSSPSFGSFYEMVRPLLGTAYGGGGPTLAMLASMVKSRRKKNLEDDLGIAESDMVASQINIDEYDSGGFHVHDFRPSERLSLHVGGIPHMSGPVDPESARKQLRIERHCIGETVNERFAMPTLK